MAITDLVIDTASAVTFLISGFIAANLALHLSQHKIRRTEIFDVTLWSFALSIVIYGIDLAVDNLLVGIGVIPEGQLSLYFPVISIGLAFPIGVFGALVLLWDWADSLRNWLHRRAGVIPRVRPSRTIWDGLFAAIGPAWVFVQTEDGKEFYGGLAASSVNGEPRELLLRDPCEIGRGDDGQVEDKIPLGEKLLFLERDIRRVVIFKTDQPQPDVSATSITSAQNDGVPL